MKTSRKNSKWVGEGGKEGRKEGRKERRKEEMYYKI